MRGVRDELRRWTDTVVDFGTVLASEVSDGVKNILVTVRGTQLESDTDERKDRQPLYGHAGVLVRPPAPTAAGAFEVVFLRVEDELTPFASRDVRWQVELEEGEVVVRNLSDTPARVRLQPDGTVIVEGENIKLGSADTSKHVAFREDVESALSSMRTAYNTHKHTETGGTTNVPDTTMSDPGALGSEKVEVE